MLLLYLVRLKRQHIQGKPEWTMAIPQSHTPTGQLAQIGVMSATASRPLSDFTFQALQMVESCWVVDPLSVDGMTLGMVDQY
ncbi:BQ5605_C012g07016 [Microbotryum silenes-dioicae]|uniref:BQ5605_C012g07016 protein n=1 Tax=Microbotryum silenes-dioicae TaxID=796604 RepID=A0A2X0NQ74_9BASI|nr:BQ5605_C012g07016 [Microbotryum silenes-dioicae]